MGVEAQQWESSSEDSDATFSDDSMAPDLADFIPQMQIKNINSPAQSDTSYISSSDRPETLDSTTGPESSSSSEMEDTIRDLLDQGHEKLSQARKINGFHEIPEGPGGDWLEQVRRANLEYTDTDDDLTRRSATKGKE